jgi:hypothetical protein
VTVFRVLLAAFGIAVTVLAVRFINTGERRYLRWALRVLAGALVSGVVFFAILLATRLA